MVLPASAGMIHPGKRHAEPDKGAPRIRGDDPVLDASRIVPGMCSPHPRG